MFDTVTGKTRIHFLIGSPIRQVLAPGLLSRRLSEAGVDAVLVPLQIEPEDIAASLPALMKMPNVDSILVTIPHKFVAFQHCRAASTRAQALGAINAMRRTANGDWFGDNFDGAGFVRGLGQEVGGRTAYMVGCGAAGSSIAVALLDAGIAQLRISDLDAGREARLLDLLDRTFPGRTAIGDGHLGPVDIVVNASSAGLNPSDPLPVPIGELTSGMLVGDVITDPLPTAFIRAAGAAGCATRDGKDMLEGQMDLLLAFMLGRTGPET